MKQLIIATFLVSITLFVSAQNLNEDLKKIQNTYQTMDSYSGQIETKVYGTSSKPMLTKVAKIKKKDRQFFYQLEHLTTLMNNDFLIVHDAKAKFVSCQPMNRDKKAENLLLQDIDKMMMAFEKGKYLGLVNQQKHYAITLQANPEIASIELFVTANTYLIEKVIYHYKENSQGVVKVVLDYQKQIINPKLTNQVFSESRFIQKTNESWTLQPSYRDCKLLVNSEYQ